MTFSPNTVRRAAFPYPRLTSDIIYSACQIRARRVLRFVRLPVAALPSVHLVAGDQGIASWRGLATPEGDQYPEEALQSPRTLEPPAGSERV